MDNHFEKLLKEILDQFDQVEYIRPSDIPDIGMYMDQVTTFMDSRLSKARRTSEDKLLTKTMINNYTKQKLLPPPDRKKYSREHLLVLLFIYYYKGILSLEDIRTLLRPLGESYFQNSNGPDITAIYEEIFRNRDEQISSLREDISQAFEKSQASFENIPAKDRDFLRLFNFISSLVLDIYMKRRVIELLIDNELNHPN